MTSEKPAIKSGSASELGFDKRSSSPASVTDVVRTLDHDGEAFDPVPQGNRRIGTLSAAALIANRIIGTGIFATPASILGSTGSVGMSLMLWLIGSIIAAAGTLVYLEWATSIPRSGGEKNYLEFFYRRPVHLITAMYAVYAALLGWPAGNSEYAGQLFISAAGGTTDRWNSRAIGVGVVTFVLLVNGIVPRYGLWLSNLFGVFKLGVLLFIIISGFVALGGKVQAGAPNPSNFRNAFAGTTGDANAFVNALYNVIWSFIGYSNVFYAMSEIRNPIKTVKRAVPIALAGIIVLYMLVNIAFFAAVPKADMIASERLVAVEFSLRMFGPTAARAMSIIIGLSAIGNALVVLFAQGRINQELGREGILPFSRFFASNKPFNAPFAGLGLQWLVTVIIILAPPAGDAYSFLLNLVSYPLNLVNLAISFGLIVVYFRKEHYNWRPPVKATLPVVVFFFTANLFLVIVPFIPPEDGQGPYNNLPYYLHCVVGFGLFGVGALYWFAWAVVLPRIGRYTLSREVVVGSDGLSRNRFTHLKDA